MSDQSSNNSAEQIAYLLLATIAQNEGRSLSNTAVARATADRRWLLDAYAECMMAVTHPETRAPETRNPETRRPEPRKAKAQ